MSLFKRGTYDSVTGLQDRESFFLQAEKTLRSSDEPNLSAVYLNLLNIGAYTVRCGDAAGEKVIKSVAAFLCDTVTSKRVGRFSTGSFMALMPADLVEDVVEKINRELPTTTDSRDLVLKAGYCPIKEGLTIPNALSRAQYAFEDILLDSPVQSRLFDRGLETAFERRAYVVEHLDDAIERGEIQAYSQPIIRVLTGRICEVEVLARWESEQFGFLRPDEFIPELERSRLIHKLDAEVIRRACQQWSEAAQKGIHVPFGINLSRLDFELTDIYGVVVDCMARYRVPIDQVHIEVTESALAHNDTLLDEGIGRFKRAGFMLYLDDFGSGYSSLQVLEGTGFDVAKLDMSLLQEVETNERARVIVADAVSMIKRLAMQTLCEGVETEDQYLFLKAVGCEKAQGYYFGRPTKHEDTMSRLNETAKLHESPEDKRYFDSVGRVNLLDGSRSDVQGVEAASFVGTKPFAIVEARGSAIALLAANNAFERFIGDAGIQGSEDFVNRMSTDFSDIRTKGLFAASKARALNESQQFDFIANGHFCTLGITHVDSSQGRDAYLVEVLSVAQYSQFNDFRLLEQSLTFLYTTFKRIDLLDVTDQTWRNIYLNVPRYTSLRANETPQDEINAFCETFIHPDDRERFLEFYRLDTVEERARIMASSYVSSSFFALSDNERYEEQMFLIIPVSMGGHKQYLSCLKSLDDLAHARNKITNNELITDDVLLTGILNIPNRVIFWKDTRLRYIGANDAFLNYFGVDDVGKLLGRTGYELGFDALGQKLREDELEVLKGMVVLDFETIARTRHGVRRCRCSKMPLFRNGRVIGLVGFIVDLGAVE
ncbi:MAG: EAL domain-containing protein [Coriobacteriales bacterium]|nr:EAL domain-containing protein [Coriobacteriales bacterium]